MQSHATLDGPRPEAGAPAARHRPVLPSDPALLRARSEGGALDRLVLRPRFGSFDAFLADALDDRVRRAFYLSQEAGGGLAGWACCLRFHEREGYAGAALWLAELGATPAALQASREQLALCIAACVPLGVHTLVATLHGAMADDIAWHAAQGFRACGSVPLADGQRLRVLARRIAG